MQNDEVHRKLQIVGRVVKTYVQNPQKIRAKSDRER